MKNEEVRKDMEKALQTILACMSGADGGVSYMNLRFFLEGLDVDIQPETQQLATVVKRFATLIEAVNDLNKEPEK